MDSLLLEKILLTSLLFEVALLIVSWVMIQLEVSFKAVQFWGNVLIASVILIFVNFFLLVLVGIWG